MGGNEIGRLARLGEGASIFPVHNIFQAPAVIVLALALAACGGGGEVSTPQPIPDHLMAGGGAPEARVRLAPVGEDPAAFAESIGDPGEASLLTREEDIVWTDPDNPDANLPEIEELIRESRDRDDWENNLAAAGRRAMREGRPLLVWFTDSQRSSVCKTLSTQLFSTPDFDAWAREGLIRVRLDWSSKIDGNDQLDRMDAQLRRRAYLEKLEKRYKVTGKPHVVVMAPDGTVTGRYRGYRSNSADFFWGKLKHSVILAEEHHEKWAQRMRKKGYRVWTSKRGDFSSFAKLRSYRDGELILVEASGARFRTHEKNLSQADRHWIAKEKAKRR